MTRYLNLKAILHNDCSDGNLESLWGEIVVTLCSVTFEFFALAMEFKERETRKMTSITEYNVGQNIGSSCCAGYIFCLVGGSIGMVAVVTINNNVTDLDCIELTTE